MDFEEGLPQQDNNDMPQTENCKERNPHEELTKIILFFKITDLFILKHN